jgi:outer membrane protein assembly factor BamB
MYQQDAQHTGRSPYAGPRQATILRRFDTSLPQKVPSDPTTTRADFQSSSAIGPDGTIYVANFPGALFALRDSSGARGEVIWDNDAHNEVWSAPSIRPDGTLVIADRGGLIQVLG